MSAKRIRRESRGVPTAAADSNEKSSEVQIQYGENDFKTDPIGKNDSSANNGGSVIKEVRLE